MWDAATGTPLRELKGHTSSVTSVAFSPDGKLLRAIIKTVVLALAYNMGPWKLRDRLTIALHQEVYAVRDRRVVARWAVPARARRLQA